MFIFMLLAMRYKYVTHEEDEDPEMGEKSLKPNNDQPAALPPPSTLHKEDPTEMSYKENNSEHREPNGFANEGYDHNEDPK